MQGYIAEELADCAPGRQACAKLLAQAGPLLAALGDETRQSIVGALLNADEVGLRVGQITEATNLSRPAVSHHLKVLKDAGAVTLIKRGTMNFYFIDKASSRWEAFWALSDATRALARHAHKLGYPDIYRE